MENIIIDICTVVVKLSSSKSFESYLSDEFFEIIILYLGKSVNSSKSFIYSYLLVLNKMVNISKKSVSKLASLNSDEIL